MNTIKKVIIAVALFTALGLSALFATGNTPLGSIAGNMPVAHADCTQGFPPIGGTDCWTPTPVRE